MVYEKYIRDQLKITNTRVRKWVEWNPHHNFTYEAYLDSRSVVIPKPVCAWSFLIGLHEIGHISTGRRKWSYLMEYNAEMWAIKKAAQLCDLHCPEYETDARLYVRQHVISNLVYSNMEFKDIKPYVLEWLNEDEESLRHVIKINALHNLFVLEEEHHRKKLYEIVGYNKIKVYV